jgi:diacylglycerol kinase (ATP)
VKKPDSIVRVWCHRFACAGRGLRYVLTGEPSGRVHLVALGAISALGGWLGLTALEWAVIALAASGVIAAEALNTAVERLADRVSLEREESIRLIKDAAAGGVLAAAVGAVAAGLAILGPKLWAVAFG